MQFQLSEEQLMIQKAARDFAQHECLPGVIERDEHQKFPKEQVMKLAGLGFMGMMIGQIWRCRNGYHQLCAGHGRNQQDRCQCQCVHERKQ